MKWIIIVIASLFNNIKSTASANNNDLLHFIHLLSPHSVLNHAHTEHNHTNETITFIDNVTASFFNSLSPFIANDITKQAVIKCNQSLTALMNRKNINVFYEFFTYSGKGLSDIGFESECSLRNLSYFKVIYDLNLNAFSIKDEKEVMRFLNQNSFYTGFCLIEQCRDAIKAIIADNSPALFSYLETHFQLKNISLLSPPAQPYNPPDPMLKVYVIMIYCFIGYFGLKLMLTIVKISFFSAEENQLSFNNQGIELEEEEDDTLMQKELNDSSSEDNRRERNSQPKPVKQPKVDIIFKKKLNVANGKPIAQSLLFRFVNFFDIFQNIKSLSTLTNKYYNDKRIALFSFVRFLLLFFVTYNHNFFTITKMPGKDFLNSDFYKSFLFCFIKISTHSTSLWIVMDSATFSYKFMSSIKREMRKKNERSISILFILRWWLLTLPKMMSFFFIFYFFHFFMAHYKYFFRTGTMFEFYLDRFQTRDCKKNPIELFIPFAISYKDSNKSFVYCYRFCYVYLNELYLFIFCTIYFYVAFKLKSKLMDYVLLALTVLNMVLTTLSLPIVPSTAFYHINNVLGQSTHEKYTHLSASFYLLGIFIGMSYFYYYDAVSNRSLTQNDYYVPFCFCFSFVKFLDTLRYCYKKVLLYLLVFLCFLDSLSYFFIRIARMTNENSLLLPMDVFINVFDHYDKILFAIAFSVILVLLLLFPKDTTIRHIINSNLFIPFSRIGYAYFCLSNTIIYVVYCVVIIQLKLSYPNLVYITIGLLLVNSFISLLVVILIELPFRVLIKKVARLSRQTEAITQEKMMIEVNSSMKIMDED